MGGDVTDDEGPFVDPPESFALAELRDLVDFD
jgi:hypothetical protein